jgi:hypothetical protein
VAFELLIQLARNWRLRSLILRVPRGRRLSKPANFDDFANAQVSQPMEKTRRSNGRRNIRSCRSVKRAPAASVSTNGSAAHRQQPDLSRDPLFRGLSSGDYEFDDDTLTKRLMVCVDGRNLDFVRSLRKTSDNDRPAAGVGPDPRCAINRHMEMPDAGRHIKRLGTEHREDLQIFGAVPDEGDSATQRFGQWRIDHDFRLRLGGLSDGVGHPQNGCRYDKADECLRHVCFSLLELTRADDVIH